MDRHRNPNKRQPPSTNTPAVTNPPAISIIIPLAPNDNTWQNLLPALHAMITPPDHIIIAAAHAPNTALPPLPANTTWLHCQTHGRAAQMNEATHHAKNNYLWFVHADSQPPATALAALKKSLAKHPNDLHYFNLKFYDGGWQMRLNEWGVALRCRLFSNPFGDQALALSAQTFAALQRYDETAPYGEDHLLTLRARAHKIKLRCVGQAISTSARAYRQNGWLKTIGTYQYLWIKQWMQKQ